MPGRAGPLPPPPPPFPAQAFSVRPDCAVRGWEGWVKKRGAEREGGGAYSLLPKHTHTHKTSRAITQSTDKFLLPLVYIYCAHAWPGGTALIFEGFGICVCVCVRVASLCVSMCRRRRYLRLYSFCPHLPPNPPLPSLSLSSVTWALLGVFQFWENIQGGFAAHIYTQHGACHD